jgi:ornithine cyclodeaminase/alanine dehydrogenase-like protein (mu-crystallin family)
MHQEAMMADVLLLSHKDMAPLRNDLASMDGALKAVEDAVVANYKGEVRQGNLVDRRPGEFEGIRLALLAGDETLSGLRIFGNPPHTRAFMLFDGETREMRALLDYGVLNSLRVGAIAGVAAKHLAPKGARTLGLIGSGWQAPPQVAAMRRGVPSLNRIKVFSPTQAHRESFATKMTEWLGIQVEPVTSVKEALADADIVDLCAPGHFDVREPLYEPDWVQPGALVVAMGGNQSPGDFVAKARVVANRPNDPMTGIGRIEPYGALLKSGQLKADDVTELGAVIVDSADPRRTPDDSVVFHLEGGTAHDLFVATWGYEWAIERGLGTTFDLREGEPDGH